MDRELEKGLMGGEVMKYDEYMKYGCEGGVGEGGKVGMEGKE